MRAGKVCEIFDVKKHVVYVEIYRSFRFVYCFGCVVTRGFCEIDMQGEILYMFSGKFIFDSTFQKLILTDLY